MAYKLKIILLIFVYVEFKYEPLYCLIWALIKRKKLILWIDDLTEELQHIVTKRNIDLWIGFI
jgi:hypothetical protein